MSGIFEKTLPMAAAGAAAGAVVLAISAYRAIELPALEPEPLALAAAEEATPAPEFRALPAEAVSLIADNEPFREDRERAPLRYLMPGDRMPAREEAPPPPPPEPPPFTILGTVLTADGGMALIRTNDGLPPLFVNIDESIGGYRLVSVGPEGATLSQGDVTFNLAVTDPAVTVREQPSSRGRTNNNRRNNDPRIERQEQLRQTFGQQAERVQQLMEQVRQRGGAQGGAAGLPVLPSPAPGTRVLVTPDGQGNIIIREQQNVDPATGAVRQRVIAIPSGPRQAQ